MLVHISTPMVFPRNTGLFLPDGTALLDVKIVAFCTSFMQIGCAIIAVKEIKQDAIHRCRQTASFHYRLFSSIISQILGNQARSKPGSVFRSSANLRQAAFSSPIHRTSAARCSPQARSTALSAAAISASLHGRFNARTVLNSRQSPGRRPPPHISRSRGY